MRNLSNKGLSMSQAQSVSNLCNQRAQEINNTISSVNNAEKTVVVDRQKYITVPGIAFPSNIKDLILEKSRLHACQGFLMEAIKAKDGLISDIQDEEFVYDVQVPEREMAPSVRLDESVTEQWGWNQLSDSEMSDYLMNEAYASHIGQFIHNRGKLDTLRRELTNMPSIEWMEVEYNKKNPVQVVKHHTSASLLQLHEELAQQHRAYEQRVNYFKAKVKNLVTDENARIQKLNAERLGERARLQGEFDQEWTVAYTEWSNARDIAESQFKSERELRIKDAAALRISVDSRFQDVIDMFITAE